MIVHIEHLRLQVQGARLIEAVVDRHILRIRRHIAGVDGIDVIRRDLDPALTGTLEYLILLALRRGADRIAVLDDRSRTHPEMIGDDGRTHADQLRHHRDRLLAGHEIALRHIAIHPAGLHMHPALGPLRIHLEDVHGRTVRKLTHDVREIVLVRCRTEVDVAVTLHDAERRILLQHPLQRIRLYLIGETLNLRFRRNRFRDRRTLTFQAQLLLFHDGLLLPAAHQYADHEAHNQDTENERRNQKNPLLRLTSHTLFFSASSRLSHKNAPIL